MKNIKQLLERQGRLVIRLSAESGTASKGMPDLIVIENGKAVGIELKTQYGKLRESQIDRADINKNNLETYVLRSNQYDGFKHLLKKGWSLNMALDMFFEKIKKD